VSNDGAGNDGLEQRLAELEVRLTFIDDTVEALAVADADQSQRIAALERALRELRGELMSVRLGQAPDPQSEPPPPHY
jgi:SlyX protein